MEQKMIHAPINDPPGKKQITQHSKGLDFIIKLLTDGFLREMDQKIINIQKNIRFPKVIYAQCFKFFPRFETAELIKNPLLNLNMYVAGCYLQPLAQHINIVSECTQKIRKTLSIECNPPIDEIINTGVTPKLIDFLSIDYYKHCRLQFEACWSLTNICSGTRAHVLNVINNKHNPYAIPNLINLLNSENTSLKEQSIWALGNICGDSPQCRNIVLSNNILHKLIPVIQSICHEMDTTKITQDKLALLRNATWTLSNLCRGKPTPDVEYIISIIPILNTLLTVSDDEILMDTLWSYSYLTETPSVLPKNHFPNRNMNGNNNNHNGEGEGPPPPQLQLNYNNNNNNNNNVANGDGPHVQLNINNNNEMTVLDLIFLSDGVISCIINLLDDTISNMNIIHPALRILGNICTSNDCDTQKVLDYGLLDKLYKLLNPNNQAEKLNQRRNALKREALWTISNIMAGNAKQIEIVINNRELMKILFEIMIFDKHELSKEAVWCIANALSCCNDRQIDYLIIHHQIIPNLCQFIKRFRIRLELQIANINTQVQLNDLNREQEEKQNRINIHNFNPPFTSFTSLRVALEGIDKILQIEHGKYALFAEQYGLLSELESLINIHNSLKTLNNQVLIRCNDIICTYYSQSPSQIIKLLVSDSIQQRKQCCLLLLSQLKNGSIFHCKRIIECENMIRYLLENLFDFEGKNDIFLRNDIICIISDLLKKLDNSLQFLKDIQDINNVVKVIQFIIDCSVLLPAIDFLLFLINPENNKKYKNNINIGKTIYLIMEIIEIILKYKTEEIVKFYIIKYDGVYAMKEIINNYNYYFLNNKQIINISSKIMKQYFKFSAKNKTYPNFEKTLVFGYFRIYSELFDMDQNMKEIVNIIEICCYYGYDYSFEENKRRSSVIIESRSILQSSTSQLVQFDDDDNNVIDDIDDNDYGAIDYDDVLLDLNFDDQT